MSQSDKIKNDVDFLKHEANHKEFQLVKTGRKVLNLKKSQLYSTIHAPIHNYFINPKNNYSEKPFNGSSSFYIDFDINNGLNATFYQFVLRFTTTNTNTTKIGFLMPNIFMIEKVSLLKNSNSLGLDVDSWDILLYNLHKYYKDLHKENIMENLGLNKTSAGNLIAFDYIANGSISVNIEIPISLNRSDILMSAIKDQLTLRVYFKSSVVYDGVANSDVKLSNVGLVLRVQELNNSQLTHLYKQPKFDHMFNKRVKLTYNINKIEAGVEQSIPLAGFRNVAGSMLLFITRPSNEINFTTLGYQAHLVPYKIDNVYIVDNAGRNIQNNNKQDFMWNKYLMANHFKRSDELFKRLISGSDYNFNNGHFTYLPFCADGSDSFDGHFSGGFSFSGSGDHILRFTPISTYSGNLVLNMIAFVPALLSVNNGELSEELA